MEITKIPNGSTINVQLDKFYSVVKSCETEEQLNTAINWGKNLFCEGLYKHIRMVVSFRRAEIRGWKCL